MDSVIQKPQNGGELPFTLFDDARDFRLPLCPPAGFRNLFHEREAPEARRWGGCGDMVAVSDMLAALARQPLAAGLTPSVAPALAAFGRLALLDMLFSLSRERHSVALLSARPLRLRRLTLETLYGDGPQAAPERYRARDPALLCETGVAAAMARDLDDGDWRAAAARGEAPARGEIVAAALMLARLHNRAATALGGESRARFQAARRIVRAAFRRILFGEMLPAVLRPDVVGLYEFGRFADVAGREIDDVPVEFSHVALRAARALTPPPMARAAQEQGGRVVRFCAPEDAPAPRRASADVIALRHAPARDALGAGAACAQSGALRISALASGFSGLLLALPGAQGWAALSPSTRAQLFDDALASRPDLARWADCLRDDPPLHAFLLMEAAAPEALGGGGGRRFGALGSAILCEPFFAARAASAAAIENDERLAEDEARLFGANGAPCGLADLAEPDIARPA